MEGITIKIPRRDGTFDEKERCPRCGTPFTGVNATRHVRKKYLDHKSAADPTAEKIEYSDTLLPWNHPKRPWEKVIKGRSIP